ncbi:Uncharacterised protein [Shigella sonnei]|nr:Uncharacterised protein [Shigella sonnei]
MPLNQGLVVVVNFYRLIERHNPGYHALNGRMVNQPAFRRFFRATVTGLYPTGWHDLTPVTVPVCGQADGIQNGISKFGRVFRLHSGSISRCFSGPVLRDFRKC